MDDAHAPTTPVRLTSLAHGGGCGCKIAPAVLQEILAEMPAAAPFANLLVGTESSDDAAVWKLNDDQALVATTDFFMPVVDDPFDFGRIAATNALSDVYAMGERGEPNGRRGCACVVHAGVLGLRAAGRAVYSSPGMRLLARNHA